MDVFSNFTSNRIQFMQSTGVIILAAGISERMGSDKLCLKLPSGETFLSYLLSAYQRFGCTPCIVVVNQKTQPHALQIIKSGSVPATVVVNPNPEAGRFLSLQMGLQALKNPTGVFLQNIDNPFVNEELLQHLIANSNAGDFVVPVYGIKGGHPVLLNPKVVNSILLHPDPHTPLNGFLKNFQKAILSTSDRRILTNINTPDDYREYLAEQQADSSL